MNPDVSIILITFEDAVRLPRALESLRNQTLTNLEIIVVDDASTDDTPAIVEQAVALDPRVRSVRLPSNSGGCSRPRNVGLEQARAPWVMFCDSDDLMDRHAAKSLLLAAERGGCDVACGVAERVDVRTGERRPWRIDLHEPAILGSLDERPGLLADTVSVNKLYRRAFLAQHQITFPEGILYEDQRFTFEALALARGIAVLDQVVYTWHVERLAEEPSITQRRAALRNVTDRVAVNRLIDAAITDRGLERFRMEKDRKFLAHDTYLHLGAVLDADDEDARAIMGELAPYVATIDPEAAGDLRPALRVAIAHLLLDDLEHVRSAMRALRWAASIDTPITQRGAHEVWSCGHEDGPPIAGRPAAWWLDVTALRIRQAPIGALRPCHLASHFGPEMTVQGSTTDITGLGAPDAAFGAMVGGDRTLLTCGAQVSTGDGRWDWSLDGRWQPMVSDALVAARSGTVCLGLRFGDDVMLQPLRAGSVPTMTWRIGSASFRGVGTERGEVGWERTATRRRPMRKLGARLAGALARRLPARGVVLWSLDGVGAGDAMLELRRSLPEALWVFARDEELAPDGLDVGTARGAWAVGRARVVVCDAGLPPGIRRSARVMRLQSDVPITRTGADAPDWDLTPPRRRVPAMVRRWNALALPSASTEHTIADAVGFSGERIVTGSLRGARIAEVRGSAKARLGLRDDRAVVLWAPAEPDPIDPDAAIARGLQMLVDALGDRAFILVRARRRVRIPAALRSSARDVSRNGDAALTIAAADVVISDVSPLLIDAVRAGIPVVCWSERYPAIDRETGLAFDLTSLGPVVHTAAQCAEAFDEVLGSAVSVGPEILARAGAAGGGDAVATWIRQAAS